jgi:hypothetical protein
MIIFFLSSVCVNISLFSDAISSILNLYSSLIDILKSAEFKKQVFIYYSPNFFLILIKQVVEIL